MGLSEPLPYGSCLWTFRGSGSFKPVGLSGLEPPTSRLSGVRSNQLSYKPIFEIFRFQWRWRDSNSRPPACKAGALPTELHPHLIWHPPALPHRLQCSTIGRLCLNRRVRDGNGCFPQAHRHQKSRVLNEYKIYRRTNLVRTLFRGTWWEDTMCHRI